MQGSYDTVLGRTLPIVTQFAKGNGSIDEETVMQADVGLTSLQIMELILEVEEEFDISFPLNLLPGIQTVKDLAEAIVTALEQ